MRHHLMIWGLLLLALLQPGGVAAQAPEASPVTSGAGWRIADIREIDLDTRYAALSPDGRSLAGVGADNTICVWDIATLAPSCAGERLPIREETITWAPDGTAVAFALDAIRQLYESDIFVYEVASGELANVTDDGIDGDVLGTLDQQPPIDDAPAWSPDSRQIAFARSYSGDEEPGTTTLMRIDRAGGEAVEVLELDVEQPFTVWLPMYWLPDDTLLYSQISNDMEDPRNGVWKVGIDDGSSPLQIAPGAEGMDIPGPRVSSIDAERGQAIVFSVLLANQFASAGDQPLFWLVDIASGDRTPLFLPNNGADPPVILDAAFSPDGATVLLVTLTEAGLVLMTMDSESGALAPVDGAPMDAALLPDATVRWAGNDTVLLHAAQAPLLITLERAS